MPVRIVQSKQNSRLKELRRALTHPGREESTLAGIEGPNLLAEALRAGLQVQCVFVAQNRQQLLDQIELSSDTEVLLVPGELLSSVLATETPQPVAALIEPPRWTWDHILDAPPHTAPLILMLAGIQDPGNLGTILRSAEAFGATGVISLPGTVSPWNPKAVRASAGSVFRMPLLNASAKDAFKRVRQANVKILGTSLHDAQLANTADLAAPFALLIGNEGNGVAADIAAQADAPITIPCPGPVESLNAAVAASVLLYEASRQRAAGSSRNHRERPR